MVLNLIRKLQKGLLVMKELIQFIAHELVDYPEKVTVHEVIGNSTAVLELNVAKEDLGKVIGKHGRTAQAMRTLGADRYQYAHN